MEYKNRKYPRLKEYDYSLPGYYYVTIHNGHGAPQLSQIHPGDIHCRAAVMLTQAGKIAVEQMLLPQRRYPYVQVAKFVVMPPHIHGILRLKEGKLPRPGLTDIVGAYKSLVTRAINAAANTPGRKQFQRSFYETVIRCEKAYQSCWRYIDENPDKWGMKEESEWKFLPENKDRSNEPE